MPSSSRSRYSPTDRQSKSMSSPEPFHPAIARRTSPRVRSSTGAYDSPSWPMTSRVTPCAALALWSGSRSSARSLWACMSMKPGERTRPSASSSRRAFGRWQPAAAASLTIETIRPPSTTTSAR
ncbi:hypothetical protein SVIOM342S_09511 [Streptomyces violaceorubidus]